jgi:outer membrane protein TolC
MTKSGLHIFLFLSLSFARAQYLTLEEATQLALKNNYNAQIAKNNTQIAKLNNFVGNTGKLPRVNLNINDNYQWFGINQLLANGTETNRSGANSNNLNATIRADWMIFNGFRVQKIQERLSLQEQNNQQILELQNQQVIASVITAYTDIVRQKQIRKVLQSSLEVAQKRMEIIKKRVELGTANQTDVQLASLDIHTQNQAVVSQDLFIKQAKVNLNILVGKKAEEEIEVSETIVFQSEISLEDLKKNLENNPRIKALKNAIQINKNLERETEANLLPTFNLNAGYSYTRNNSTAGFLLLNQNYGPFIGFNFSLPLYNGSINTRQVEIARMQTKTQELELARVMQEIEGELERQWQAYQTAKEQAKAEETNAKIAQEYLSLMQKRFELGQSNIIEIREAQRVVESTEGRKIQSLFNLKMAETQLLLAAGLLKVQN